MLGSAVQVRPLLPSSKKAAQTGGLFCGGKVIASRLADPALFLLGTAQEGLPVQVRPLLPSSKKAAQTGGLFGGGKVLPVSGLFAVLALMLVETVGGLRQGTLETWILRTFMTVDEQSHIPGLLIG